MKSIFTFFLVVSGSASTLAIAAPIQYTIDPDHTHPSFEVDHFGGLSVWRGNFKKTSGTISLDTAAKSGMVDVTIDLSTIDFAEDKLNEHVKSAEMLDVKQFPTATYSGKLGGFKADAPTTVTGNLTLHGVTKPVSLTIKSFKCMANPMTHNDVCGADATGTFNRADFGVDYGSMFGFKQEVTLHIQVEAIKTG